jgi:hypothetical protein
MNWIIGSRKLIISIATLLIQLGMVWVGKEALTPDVTTNIVGIINSIIDLIILLSPTIGGIAYLVANIRAKQIAAGKK